MRLPFIVRACARRVDRANAEAGLTLPELMISMAILGIVVASLTGVLVSSMHSETDLNNRFQTQSQARQALTKLTTEIRCANQITVWNTGASLSSTAVSGINLTLPAGCPTGGAAAITVSWCTVADGSTSDLYRYTSSGCTSSSVRWASSLVNSTPFSLPAASTTPGLHYSLVHLDLKVNTGLTSATAYDLVSDVAAQNGVRS